MTTTYFINRCPTKLFFFKTPYERLFHYPPCYSHLKCFGCLPFASTLSQGRSKLAPRAEPCVFLGYPFGKKGYKLLSLISQKCFISRDVKLHEDIYPFAAIQPLVSLFPFDIPQVFYEPDFSSHTSAAPVPVISVSHSLVSTSSIYSPDPIVLRKSTRSVKTAAYLQDYVCNSVHLSPVFDICLSSPSPVSLFAFSALSHSNQNYITYLSHIQ